MRDLAAIGVVYLDWCTTIPPFMHFAVVDLRDARLNVNLAHEPPVLTNGIFKIPLRRINTLAASAIVATNGFTWVGDQGNGSNQFGLPKGFVSSTTTRLGTDLTTGGVSCPGIGSPCPVADGNKFLMKLSQRNGTYSFYEESGVQTWFDPYGIFLSTSTSLIKNELCSYDTLSNRWTAIGMNRLSMLIIGSSVSGTVTSVNEMCQSFRSLYVDNALRLDGSSAAGMMLTGRHLNPLQGAESFYYGSARYIPYALKIYN